jgi:hypothetical protein
MPWVTISIQGKEKRSTASRQAISRAVQWRWTIAAAALAFAIGIDLFCRMSTAIVHLVPDVYWNCAMLYVRAERWADARADLLSALACAAADWQQRQLAQEYASGIAGRNP